MNDEILVGIKEKLSAAASKNKKITAILKRVSVGKASFSDTAEYNEAVSELLGKILSESIPELKEQGLKETICIELLRDRYEDINRILAQVQMSLDEKAGIKIAPQKAAFPAERVQKAAHSLEDATVTAETITRRAEASAANISRSFHDDYMEENARFRSDAGLQCYINRETDGNCCEWCSALAGRYEYDVFTMPEDIFRRHDNCGCTVTFENGRIRQNVWTKRTWEVPAVTRRDSAPTRLSTEQAREIQGRNLRYRGIEAESSKLKIDNPNTIVNLQNINSSSYRRLFEQIDDNPHTSRTIFQNAKSILTHRNSTEYEDLVFINSLTGEVRSRTDFNVPKTVRPSKSMMKMLKDCESNTIIAIHNHPNSTVPSISDINAARDRKYKYGIIACHNGNLYKYKITKDYDEMYADMLLDKLQNIMYNEEKLGNDFSDKLDNVLKQLQDNGLEMKVIL